MPELIEQVAEAMHREFYKDTEPKDIIDPPSAWNAEARAALGVVEKWLRLNGNAYVSGATLADELLNKLRAAMAKEAKRD